MNVRSLARRLVPVRLRRALVRATRWPPVGRVSFGSLRRVDPLDEDWGAGRGRPVDRYYIEAFLERHRTDVRGRVLEVGTDAYTRRFGGDRVTRADVLHVEERHPGVTLIGDLTDADHVPSDTFDCVILTQTLQCIFDVQGAIRTAHRILKPGGVVLATVPGISKVSRYDMDRWGHYWSFTTASARRLFEAVFPPDRIDVGHRGNVLAATAFLHGLAAEELTPAELDHVHPDFHLLISVRAVKPGAAGGSVAPGGGAEAGEGPQA